MTLTVHYSPDYIAAAHAFDTTRKSAWVADAVRDLDGVRIAPPADRWDGAALGQPLVGPAPCEVRERRRVLQRQRTRRHGEALGLDRVRHLDLTTKPFDSYTHRTPRPGDINIEDITLDGDDARYLDAVDTLLDALPNGRADAAVRSRQRPHLVLHNAGMDPAPGISFATLAERARRVAAALRTRGLAGLFVLAGGYTWSASQDEVAAAHASTVRAFADASTDP